MWPRRIGSLVALLAWLIATPAGPVGLLVCASALRTGPAHHHGAQPQQPHNHAKSCSSHCCVLASQPAVGAHCDFGEASIPVCEARAVTHDFQPALTPHSLPYANAPPHLA